MRLAARQFTPAIDTAFYHPNGTLYQLQPSFHTQSTEPEPTARARRAGKEFYQTTLAFMFVSFRLLVEESIISTRTTASTIRFPVRAARNDESAAPRFVKMGPRARYANISDATIQMDYNTVVLFTIDRLARSPRTTVRTRGTRKGPDRWFIK